MRNSSHSEYRSDKLFLFSIFFQINEEASEKVLEVEQKYNEIRKPVYDKRNDVIKSIPDFWLTAVSGLSLFNKLGKFDFKLAVSFICLMFIPCPT